MTKDIEPYSIIGSNPAKLIKKRDKIKTDILIKKNKCWNNKLENNNNKKIYRGCNEYN